MKRFIVSLLAMTILWAFSDIAYAAMSKEKLVDVENFITKLDVVVPETRKEFDNCIKETESDGSDEESMICRNGHFEALHAVYRVTTSVAYEVLSMKRARLLSDDNAVWEKELGKEIDACGDRENRLCRNKIAISALEKRIMFLDRVLKERVSQLRSQ